MKVPRATWIALAVLGGGLLVWRETHGQAVAPPAPAGPLGSVATLDVEEILRNYQRANDMIAALEKRRQQLELDDRKRKEVIDEAEARLRGLTEGSADYVKQLNEMRRLTIDRQASQQFEMQLFNSDHHRSMAALYDDVSRMAGIVAKEMGFKVVLYTEHRMPKTISSEQLTAVIKTRSVIYAEPSVDITEAVLKRLNDAQRQSATQPR